MAKYWKSLLVALAFVAGAIIALMFVFIVAEVLLRSLGLQPPLWTGTFVEFGLLYAAMFSAPWLISRDGHIRVRALTDRFSPGMQARLDRALFILLGALCLLLGWYGLDVLIDTARRGEVEYRSIILPRWMLFAPIAPCFLLMALEFLRLAVQGQDDHSGAEDADRSI